MTKTKRRRLYVELGNPLPGDLIAFAQGIKLFDNVPTENNLKRKVTVIRGDAYGVILALSEWLDSAMVLVHLNGRGELKIGWVELRNVRCL